MNPVKQFETGTELVDRVSRRVDDFASLWFLRQIDGTPTMMSEYGVPYAQLSVERPGFQIGDDLIDATISLSREANTWLHNLSPQNMQPSGPGESRAVPAPRPPTLLVWRQRPTVVVHEQGLRMRMRAHVITLDDYLAKELA